MVEAMARIVILAGRISRMNRGIDLLRGAIVTGCALALILAEARLLF
jgi:hypothetical protein